MNPEIREILSKAANDFLGGETNEAVGRLLSNVWRAAETYGSFMRNQQPLGREFEKVLHDNLWRLYVRS